jgi:Flp pilus assembly protein TadG
MRFSSWRRVRGSYAVLSALSMTAILGFAAMSVDVSLMRLAQGHAQAVADASALSALQVYHETGDKVEAAKAADAVTVLNPIVGSPGQISTILFGTWDPNGVGDKFSTTDPTKINSVRVTLNRIDVDLMFGRFFGALDFDVTAGATTSAQALQVILVSDITVSWDVHDIAFARDASVQFLDYLYLNHGPNDSVGHVVFFQQFGYIWTEMTNVDAAMADPLLVHKQWEGLTTGNTAGQPMPAWRDPVAFGVKHRDCKVFNTRAQFNFGGPATTCPASCKNNPNQTPLCDTCFANDKPTQNPSCQSGQSYPVGSAFNSGPNPDWTFKYGNANNYTACNIDTDGDGVVNSPFDCQCAGPDATGFNGMPHYFLDEGGTDQWTGLKAAEMMLSELEDPANPNFDPLAYKAIVILTDGQPNGYTVANNARATSGIVDPWRAFVRGSSHSTPQIENDMQSLAANLHSTYGANIWFVSFVEDHAYFANVAQGDGWYEVANTAADVTDIYDRIAKSLPQTIVE